MYVVVSFAEEDLRPTLAWEIGKRWLSWKSSSGWWWWWWLDEKCGTLWQWISGSWYAVGRSLGLRLRLSVSGCPINSNWFPWASISTRTNSYSVLGTVIPRGAHPRDGVKSLGTPTFQTPLGMHRGSPWRFSAIPLSRSVREACSTLKSNSVPPCTLLEVVGLRE